MNRPHPFAPIVAIAVTLLVLTGGMAGPIQPAGATKPAPVPTSCLPAGESAASTEGPYAVGEETDTFVDTSRPTAADPSRNLPAKPSRTLVTTLLYPAAGPADGTATPTVGAAPAAGSFPLVEFSHGVGASGPEYVPVLETWVRAGYIVAAPTFPLSSGDGGLISDEPNQPADVSFVITSVIGQAADPSDALFGHVATDCIAITGHSLGAVTTLDAVYNSCCVDARARAAISISGLALPINGGNFTNAPPTPLLLLHGDQDNTIPIGFSQQAFDELHGSRTFITFVGAGHVGLFGPPWGGLLRDAVVSFLNLQLKGDPTGSLGLARRVRASGVATIQRAS